MTKKIKTSISILLSVLMLVSLFAVVPMTAYASIDENKTFRTGDYIHNGFPMEWVSFGDENNTKEQVDDCIINSITYDETSGKWVASVQFSGVMSGVLSYPSQPGKVFVGLKFDSMEENTYYLTAVYEDASPINTHTITWKNGDTVLKTDTVEDGATPSYTGETPTKPEDDENTYEFSGWDPEIVAATADATYTAQFTATPKKPSADTEELLTTITLAGSPDYEESVPGVVSVTQDNRGSCDAENGWIWYYAGFLTVTANEGYSVTKIVFRQNEKEPVTKEGSSATLYFAKYAVYAECLDNPNMNGVTSIEVYGAATVTHTITWKNGDTLLKTDTVEDGATPSYTGETPTKPEDDENTYEFSGWDPEIVAATADATYTAQFTAVPKKPSADENIVDLGALNGDYEAKDGDVLTGTLGDNYIITIAAGAKITLRDVNISLANSKYSAGLTPLGDATIILEGANKVKGGYEALPGVAAPSGFTLTIDGTGSLDASSNGEGSGIGGGNFRNFGNIVIKGGTINAVGGKDAAAIGGGFYSSGGNITIENTVTMVTATAGDGSIYSIGAGSNGDCGTVTIGGVEGAITESPYTYVGGDPAPAKHTITWKNGDTILAIGEVEDGATPSYAGEIPTKPEDDENTYEFSGWDPEIVAATADATYTAQFTATPKKPSADTEELLTTITLAGSPDYDETVAGVVSVTQENRSSCDAEYGWLWYYGGSLTVTANEGHSVTKIVFRQNNKTPVTIEGSSATLNFAVYGECLENSNMDGVTSIEVYGKADTPVPNTDPSSEPTSEPTAKGQIEAVQINSDSIADWSSWEGTKEAIKTDDLPGFTPCSEEQAKKWDKAPSTGLAILFYSYDSENSGFKAVGFADGKYVNSLLSTANKDVVHFNSEKGTYKYFYVNKVNESKPDKVNESEPDSKSDLATAKKNAKKAMDKGIGVTQKNGKLTVKWSKSTAADGYQVYAQYCGKKTTKPVKTIKKNTTTKVNITKLNGKKLNLKKQFKVYVAAYKMVNGKKVTLAKSVNGHVVGEKNKKYTNVKSIKATKSKLIIKVGKTVKAKAKVTLVKKSKKHIPKSHAAKFRYRTSDKSIATVTKSGKIKAVKKGTCTIYIYSINGKMAKVNVTVK